MIELSINPANNARAGARIKVLGVGGGGSNAVNSMVESELGGVYFAVANTDHQALDVSPAEVKIHLGEKISKGLGAGSNPDVGRRAAEEGIEAVAEYIADADILFLTAGLGGGTGSGASPVIARAAKELGILTIAVVTKPFSFEGFKRMRQAEAAIELLRKEVDTILVVPNEKLLTVADENISMLDAFALVNNVLRQAIKGISDIIIKPGHINVDFADVRTIMKDRGMAVMGTGRASGDDRARMAAMAAISSPLLEHMEIDGAQGVLINITGNCGLRLQEINQAAQLIYDKASKDAEIILGSVIDAELDDEIVVTVIATGFSAHVVQKSTLAPLAPARAEAVRVPQGTSRPEPVVVAAQRDEQEPAELDLDDLDTPTFLRRQAEKTTEEQQQP